MYGERSTNLPKVTQLVSGLISIWIQTHSSPQAQASLTICADTSLLLGHLLQMSSPTDSRANRQPQSLGSGVLFPTTLRLKNNNKKFHPWYSIFVWINEYSFGLLQNQRNQSQKEPEGWSGPFLASAVLPGPASPAGWFFFKRPRKGESTSLERELQPPNDSAARNLSLMCFYLLFCLFVLFFSPTSFCLISSFLGFKRAFVFF